MAHGTPPSPGAGFAPTPAQGFPVVGMIGGGQLARMTQESALALGVGLRVLAAGPSESAARGGGDIRWGAHDDPDAVAAFARGCDVVTFDHEHVPAPILAALVEAGVRVRPGPAALAHAQDKVHMRAAISATGVPCPAWEVVTTPEELTAFAGRTAWPVVLKVSRGGYDGRGVWVVDGADEAATVMADNPLAPGVQWLAEQYVPFTRELAAQVARSPSGQAAVYPVVRTVQTDGICTEVVAPCPGLSDEHALAAQQVALRIAEALDVVGMLAVELFDTPEGVLVNELAMRPHNSGHWSIEGAVTSQFENHLRAVLDLPLGSPAARAPYTVMVNVLGGEHPDMYAAYRHVMARDPGLKVHMYGKDVRPGRKIGHVTVSGDDLESLLARAHHAADYLTGVIDE
ncbi:MAG: 5-(carboxyamino)imidazole ribonucleotide synthase [Candidatus Nanopelagicales bacterium]|nr:5-(carboxyamino)imidazole ribonucleotide synthase [Candidatus Nanopelagicales bacterium]